MYECMTYVYIYMYRYHVQYHSCSPVPRTVVFKGRLKKSAENLQIMQERERSVFGLLTGTDRIAGRKTGVCPRKKK
jgi:hypothetical protein